MNNPKTNNQTNNNYQKKIPYQDIKHNTPIILGKNKAVPPGILIWKDSEENQLTTIKKKDMYA